MGRTPCCDKANVKRGPWSPEEDAALRSYLETHGTVGNWIALPKKAGLRRCGKSCRLRWLNYLRPDIKHGGFTEEEDDVIISLYNEIGSRWSVIASQLPRRTDNDVKNYWNTKLKKKLLSGKINIPTSNNVTGMSSNSTCSNSSVGTNSEFVLDPQHCYSTYQGFPDASEKATVGPGTYSTSVSNYHYWPFINSHSLSPDIGSFMDFRGNMNSSVSCSGAFDSSGNSPSLMEKNSSIMSYTADGRVMCEDGGPSFGFGFSWDMLINELLFDEKSTGEISLGGIKP